mmetsp:Transcript_3144/g.9310  ORF Transcript_3144/g.9310 Transcript_3144/m.9310 type:complete len:227 (-) Transcript_3144:145-825(-)
MSTATSRSQRCLSPETPHIPLAGQRSPRMSILTRRGHGGITSPCPRQVGASLRRPQRSPQGSASFSESSDCAKSHTGGFWGAVYPLRELLHTSLALVVARLLPRLERLVVRLRGGGLRQAALVAVPRPAHPRRLDRICGLQVLPPVALPAVRLVARGRVVLAALPQLEDEHAPLPGVEPRDRVHLLREEECRVASLEGVRRQPVCAQSVEDPSAQTCHVGQHEVDG